MTMLNKRDEQRYQRHLQLKGFGKEGQEKLKRARVLIVGLGGLGCPAAQYLSAAGVGELHLMDGDVVELSNLQRQPLFCESDIGLNKATVAKRRLKELNSSINIHDSGESLTYHNVTRALQKMDLVIDCTDNFSTRYLINDTCKHLQKPWVYGSVLGYEGQFALFHNVPNGSVPNDPVPNDPVLDNTVITGDSPCFRCLFPEAADVPDCNQAGVLGVLPGSVGLQQATLALMFLSGSLNLTSTFLYLYSARNFQMKKIQLHSSDDCSLCQGAVFQESDYSAVKHGDIGFDYKISPQEFLLISKKLDVELVDVRSKEEHSAFNLGGINLPLEKWGTDVQSFIERLEQNKTYIFYCQSGVRSKKSVEAVVKSKMFKGVKIRSLDGGLDAFFVVK